MAKIDHKSEISIQCGQFDPKLQVEGVALTNHFRTDSQANECPTTLPLTVFTQRNFVADFLQAKCNHLHHHHRQRISSRRKS